MFDYQKYIAEYSIRKGRCADFLDTGTGKTIIEIVTALNYARHTNKPALIITPLAVAFQFIKEAAKFWIDDIEYSRDGKYSKKIVVCNYERLHLFNSSDFDCVILDESSILKNFDGAIKASVTAFLKRVRYRYLFTATPSPNDYVELGTSSEALGYLGYMDMISKFFSNNENNIKAQDIHTKFYLKPHAEEAFFQWVAGWSISMRNPADLGFDGSRFVLPELITNTHTVRNEKNWVVDGQILMFNRDAKRMSEVRDEQKATIEQRCEKAVELAAGHECTVYWVNYNPEGDLLERLDKNSFQLHGSMKLEAKEEILVAFAEGQIKKLITKPKMTAFGLNWQHCGHTVFFPTFSFEQWYQALRRFWRYGRIGDVIADLIISDGQKRVLNALFDKLERNDQLFDKLNKSLHQNYDVRGREFDKQIILPTFLKQAS